MRLALAALLVSLLACSDDPGQIEIPELSAVRDAAAADLPDGAVLCDDDRDCADAIECTKDVCAPGGFCVNAADSSLCSDGMFCNGAEVCAPDLGCRPGLPRKCSDADVCTVDYCDEQAKRCVHEPRDFDDDGEVDWHCFGGTDCDDFDATRSTSAAEICGDAIDNDCDELTDEAKCGAPEFDACGDALDVSAGGLFVVEYAGTGADYALSCGTASNRDVAFSFELDKPRDVKLIAKGLLSDDSEETATIAIRRNCDDVATELECRSGFPGMVRMRALEPGKYFAIVKSEQSARVVLEAHFEEPTEAPVNQSCDGAIDISAGGRFESDFVDVSNEHDIPCGFTDSEDLIYELTLETQQDVELSAISFTGEPMHFAVRTQCDAPETTLRCLSDAPARGRLHQLDPGTYYVIVESSPSREVDFSLDVAILPPTPPPPGDGCGDPIDLAPDEPLLGTLAQRQDLVNVVCGCSPDDDLARGCGLFLIDAVYRVTVDDPTDLRLRIDGGDARMAYDFRADCGSPGTQLSCSALTRVDTRLRDVVPGEYYLVVESSSATPFNLQLDSLPRTTPVRVSGNGTCQTATRVPSDGGIFQGDTALELDTYQALCGGGAISRDAVFRVELTQPSRVLARTEAGFDTVLYRFQGDASVCVPEAEAACNDDNGLGGTDSQLEEMLEPGTHYYVVDGFSESNDGRYVVEFIITQ